jgi:hypothetical protein
MPPGGSEQELLALRQVQVRDTGLARPALLSNRPAADTIMIGRRR